MEIFRKRNLALLLAFSLLGILVMGYHPGAEDDTLYLAAVKAAVNPSLFPFGSEFFTAQLKTSIFDTSMAALIHATHIPVAWAELIGQFLSIFFILLASWKILCHLFDETVARWAGIAMLTAMFTLPVAGTALYIADQYLHPRNPATALILWSVVSVLAGRRWLAALLVIPAFLLHPLMGAFGISFCCVLSLTQALYEPVSMRLREFRQQLVPEAGTPVAAVVPFGWLFGAPSASWLDAMHTRHLYFLYQWEWYEWLGAIGPLVIFWFVARMARKRGDRNLATFATAVLIYGVFQQIVAMILLSPIAAPCFATLEPMRYLHIIYIFLALIGGAYIGSYVLRDRAWRWAAFLLVANGGMLYAQRQIFADSPHIELPGVASSNPWLQAFAWIRTNTPRDAYFALDPNYMNAPREDYHSFRALAERSVLADSYKDTATVTKEPALGPEWEQQVAAQAGFAHFQRADFERLKRDFGVNWVLVAYPQPVGLACRWHNAMLSVCQIP